MSLGALIRKARLAKGYTQRSLAKVLGVTHGAIAQWEAEDTRPALDKIAALQFALDLDLAGAASGSEPYAGQLVNDPDELALLGFWRSLNRDERHFMLRMLMNARTARAGSA